MFDIMIPALEQTEEAVKTMASIVALFHRQLVEAGLAPWRPHGLTQQFLCSLLPEPPVAPQ